LILSLFHAVDKLACAITWQRADYVTKEKAPFCDDEEMGPKCGAECKGWRASEWKGLNYRTGKVGWW